VVLLPGPSLTSIVASRVSAVVTSSQSRMSVLRVTVYVRAVVWMCQELNFLLEKYTKGGEADAHGDKEELEREKLLLWIDTCLRKVRPLLLSLGVSADKLV
jgi:hypothetical protein